MFDRSICPFIFELFAINGFPTSAIAVCEIAALNHEVWDDAMEDTAFTTTAAMSRPRRTMRRRVAFEVKWLAHLAHPFLASAERAEVFHCLGHNIVEQL